MLATEVSSCSGALNWFVSGDLDDDDEKGRKEGEDEEEQEGVLSTARNVVWLLCPESFPLID
jgi:hypothetical protein